MSGVEPAESPCKGESLPAAHPCSTPAWNRTTARGFGIRSVAMTSGVSLRLARGLNPSRHRLTICRPHQRTREASASSVGVEPTAFRLGGDCTSIVLRRHWGAAANRTPQPGSQPSMLTRAVAPWSGSRESNSACPGPKPGGARCTSTQMVPRVGIEPTSPVLQTGAVTRSAVEGWAPPTGIEPVSAG